MRALRGKNGVLIGGSCVIGPYIGRVLVQEGVNLALNTLSLFSNFSGWFRFFSPTTI